MNGVKFSPRVCHHLVQFPWSSFKCVMEKEPSNLTNIIQLCNSCASWNVSISPTWLICFNITQEISTSSIHLKQYSRSTSRWSVSRKMLEHMFHDQTCKSIRIKPSIHSPNYISNIVRKVNAHAQVQSKEKNQMEIVKSISIEGWKLHHVPMDTTRGWRKWIKFEIMM